MMRMKKALVFFNIFLNGCVASEMGVKPQEQTSAPLGNANRSSILNDQAYMQCLDLNLNGEALKECTRIRRGSIGKEIPLRSAEMRQNGQYAAQAYRDCEVAESKIDFKKLGITFANCLEIRYSQLERSAIPQATSYPIAAPAPPPSSNVFNPMAIAGLKVMSGMSLSDAVMATNAPDMYYQQQQLNALNAIASRRITCHHMGNFTTCN